MYSKTAIVYRYSFDSLSNNKTKDDYYYRLRNCDTNLTSNTPANQYQRLKLIQNTVRVASSLYTMNLGALNAYTKPTAATYNVCWNQMSDRPVPSVQKTYVPTGSNNSLNNRHSSVTSSKPGSQSPGGIGCDIKHNSYDRYLNRLKGKAPLRRGVIPPTFGAPIPFNRAFPVYGGKTTKTSIVSNCNCPITGDNDSKIYDNPLFYSEANVKCTDIFKVGDYAYAIEGTIPYYVRALITDFNSSTQIYTVQFDDGSVENKNCDELKIYFPCDCLPGEDPNAFYKSLYDQTFGSTCLDSGYLELKKIL
jgi:hypothetical protein